MTKKYIAVSGGFDPVHKGHLEMIEEAAEHGDVVVLLNSDKWLASKKGKAFMDEEQRSYIMSSIKGVVNVIIGDDSDGTVLDGLKQFKENYSDEEVDLYFANGGDRKNDNVPEVEYCLVNDIKLLWNIGGEKTQSSSHLLSNWAGEHCVRDWGTWTVLKDYGSVKVKELHVLPDKELSFQKHEHRSEHWYVVKGTAYVYDSTVIPGKILKQHTTIDIPQGSWHQLCNYSTTEPLFILEVQQGEKCIEEDIERTDAPRHDWRGKRDGKSI